MLQYFDTLTDNSGNALLGATVAVTAYPGGGAVTIYSSNGTTSPIANSTVAADITGQISFYVPDGAYILTYSYKGTQYKVRSPVQIFDPLQFVSVSDSGPSANNYAVTTSILSAQKYVGLKIEMLALHTNSGASVLVYQGDAGFPITQPGGSGLVAGIIQANGLARLEWDGTEWQIIGTQSQPFYAQTPPEQSASVTPQQLFYDTTSYGNLLRYMTQTQINSINSGGSVDTASGWVNALAMATKASTYTANAGNGIAIIVPAGNYQINSKVTLPLKIKILGAGTRRGFGTPPSAFGVGIIAGFAGPVFECAPGGLTATDILLEGFEVIGNQGSFGAGNGLNFNNCAGIKMRDMVVSNFGTDNIHFAGAGSFNSELDYVYSSLAGNANFYIGSSLSSMHRCQSDGGVYSVFADANSDGLTIDANSHFEGASTRGIHLLGTNPKLIGSLVRSTVAGANGVFAGAAGLQMIAMRLFGSQGSVGSPLGFDLPANSFEYMVVGNRIVGYAEAARFAEGLGSIVGNVFEGATTGLELIGGSFLGMVEGNTLTGGTNSLLHTSGNFKWQIGNNHLDDGAGNFKVMTVTAGTPIMTGGYEGTTPPSVASATSVTLPFGPQTISITGTTAITSVSAVGFNNKIVQLIFTGILTFTNGNNLKLTGNFVTAAGSSITLGSDGTNWYEIGRKA